MGVHVCTHATQSPIPPSIQAEICNVLATFTPKQNYGGGNIICVVTQEARHPEYQNYKTNPSMRKVNDWRFVVI